MQRRISEIQVTPIKSVNGLVGFASLVFDNSFYFGSIGIYTRPNGRYRITYPTKKNMASSIHIFHPINRDVAQQIENAIVKKFEEVISN